MKENIKTVNNPLDIVGKLRGVSFDWRKDKKASMGVVAQEIENVMPAAVTVDAAGYKTVEYDQIIAPLIEAVKAEQKEIDALKLEVAQLNKSKPQ